MTETQINPAELFARNETPCICGQVTAATPGPDNEDGSPGEDVFTLTTDCQAMTKSRFAPGHDAKLKGLLIAAGQAAMDVRVQMGGTLVTTDALNVASSFGFAKQVMAGIEKARVENDGKAEREIAKAAKVALAAEAKVAKEAEKAEAKAKREAEAEAKKAERAEAKRLADEAKAAKAAEQAANAPAEGEVSAKVGRKVFNGRVEDGVFIYEVDGEEVRTTKFALQA